MNLNCLEQYYSYNNNFQYNGGGLVNGDLPASLSCGSVNLTSPTDPINSTVGGVDYKYVASGVSASGYTITAQLEQGGTFAVTNQQ